MEGREIVIAEIGEGDAVILGPDVLGGAADENGTSIHLVLSGSAGVDAMGFPLENWVCHCRLGILGR